MRTDNLDHPIMEYSCGCVQVESDPIEMARMCNCMLKRIAGWHTWEEKNLLTDGEVCNLIQTALGSHLGCQGLKDSYTRGSQ